MQPRRKGIHSLTHLAMSLGRFKEHQVSTMLIAVEVAVCVASFFLVRYV